MSITATTCLTETLIVTSMSLFDTCPSNPGLASNACPWGVYGPHSCPSGHNFCLEDGGHYCVDKPECNLFRTCGSNGGLGAHAGAIDRSSLSSIS